MDLKTFLRLQAGKPVDCRTLRDVTCRFMTSWAVPNTAILATSCILSRLGEKKNTKNGQMDGAESGVVMVGADD